MNAGIWEVEFPFVRVDYTPPPDEEGPSGPVKTWKPGTVYACASPSEEFQLAEGVGLMRLVEVSRHKPGKFPERVFYTRSFVDPGGREFGNRRLRMTTRVAFERMCRGYRVPYRVEAARG